MAVKRLFPPHYPTNEAAREALLHTIRRDPRQFGYQRSRWTLQLLAKVCDWLHVHTPASVHEVLKRLRISYKQGRDYIHSPDPCYQEKLAYIEQYRLRAMAEPERFPLLYLDELTYYRQPTLAPAYEAVGSQQPLARRSHTANTWFRVVATLNHVTGRVVYRQRSAINCRYLSDFYADLCAAYADAETIYIVVDNWPIHFHPDVLARLQPQNLPWAPRLSPMWPTEPTKKAIHDDLPIQLLCLPTYASWLNPIEKLWRWLKQHVFHLHRFSADWPGLKQQVACFLDQFHENSDELLRYVGLLPY